MPQKGLLSDYKERDKTALAERLVWLCIVTPLCTVTWQTLLLPREVAVTHEPLYPSATPVTAGHVSSSYNALPVLQPPHPGVQAIGGDFAGNASILDASFDTILYTLNLWDMYLVQHEPTYKPGQHGISQPKYLNMKTKLFYDAMLKDRRLGLKVTNICEVGMYAGASSLFWLLAQKDARLHTFDTFAKGKHLSKVAADTLIKLGRLKIIVGSSVDTVPRFRRDAPETKCDIVFIDGNKKYDVRLLDLKNFRAISHPDTLLLMDEVCSVDCAKGGPVSSCKDQGCERNAGSACMAYRTMVENQQLQILDCIDHKDSSVPREYPVGDYVCSGRFLY